MSFLEIAKSRFSCRNYKTLSVDDDKLLKVLDAFRIAPSATNCQPGHIIVVKNEEVKNKIYETYPREWYRLAPVLLVICGDHSKSWKRNDGKDHLDIDISIAIDHLTLQATDLGLATCWICNFNAAMLKSHLNLPSEIEPIAIIPLGYANEKGDENRHDTKRKQLDDFVHFDFFENK